MEVLVIHEIDLDDNEKTVVGVAESVQQAEAITKDYYGEFKPVSYQDIRDSSIEYIKVLEVKDHTGKPYQVEICLEWFTLNQV